MNGEYPVERTTPEFFSFQNSTRIESIVRNRAHSYFVSLDRILVPRRISATSPTKNFQNRFIVRHRFERVIGGRRYLIEVAPVDDKRWRANILKQPGVPAAMMPFYGETPDEAALHLTNWLVLAHQAGNRPATPARA